MLEAAGTVLTNKYAEGMPTKRYYGGCEMVDRAEILASERAKQLFGAEYANVQPHSGTQANMAVYMSVMAPGDTMLAMDLDAGGHSHPRLAGQLFRPASTTWCPMACSPTPNVSTTTKSRKLAHKSTGPS